MKLSWPGGALFGDQVLVWLLKIWLALVCKPLSSRPPTVKMLPFPSSTASGYHRAVAMSGSATYLDVPGSNRYVFGEPAFALFVAGPG